VFSSHVVTVGDGLEDYWGRSRSGRLAKKLRIPVIKQLEDARLITLCADGGHICWTGRAPALLFQLFRNSPKCEAPRPSDVTRHFSAAPTISADTVRALVQSALKGDATRDYLLALGAMLADVDVFDSKCVWPPCYLGEACNKASDSKGVKTTLGMEFASGIGEVDALLKQLLGDTSGKQWEGVSAAAVLLRLLDSHIALTYLHGPPLQLPENSERLVPDPVVTGCAFGSFVRVPSKSNLKELLLWWLNERQPETREGQRFLSYLVKPTNTQFEGWDFFVFITMDGRLRDVWGYQCKQDNTKPTTATTSTIKKSLKNVKGDEQLKALGIAGARVWLQGVWPSDG